jgi:hypothetical protein
MDGRCLGCRAPYTPCDVVMTISKLLHPRAVSGIEVGVIPNKAKTKLSDAVTPVGSVFCVMCRPEADCASECTSTSTQSKLACRNNIKELLTNQCRVSRLKNYKFYGGSSRLVNVSIITCRYQYHGLQLTCLPLWRKSRWARNNQ